MYKIITYYTVFNMTEVHELNEIFHVSSLSLLLYICDGPQGARVKAGDVDILLSGSVALRKRRDGDTWLANEAKCCLSFAF